VQVSELFPGYGHLFKVTPIPPVRSKYCQPAAFLGTLPVEIGDGLHETTPTPKQGYENKSSMMSQYVRASYNQVIANDTRSEHECGFWATLVSRANILKSAAIGEKVTNLAEISRGGSRESVSRSTTTASA
jgi:hypothetical protein